jgi:hypothetical protein
MAMRQHPGVETPGYCRIVPLGLQVADDEAAPGTPEHLLSGNAQTSRRRLAMTHRHGRYINANPTYGFSRGRWTILWLRDP